MVSWSLANDDKNKVNSVVLGRSNRPFVITAIGHENLLIRYIYWIPNMPWIQDKPFYLTHEVSIVNSKEYQLLYKDWESLMSLTYEEILDILQLPEMK